MNLKELLLQLGDNIADNEGLNYKKIDQGLSAVLQVDDSLSDYIQAEIMFYSAVLGFGAGENEKEAETTARLIREASLVELRDTVVSYMPKDILEMYKSAYDKQIGVMISPFTHGINKELLKVEELMGDFIEESGGLEELLKGEE